MENETTTTETISEEAAAKQKRIEELRKYNRDYYHAHKKASESERCKKTFSSVSALRRHQVRNIRCHCYTRGIPERSSRGCCKQAGSQTHHHLPPLSKRKISR